MEEHTVQLTDSSVTRYLKNHPRFFDRYPELLLELKITHESGDAISLVQKQLEMLRERASCQQTTIENAIEIARENSSLFEMTKRLTLQLLEADNVQDLIDRLDQSIRYDFKADAMRLCLDIETLKTKKHHALIQLQHDNTTQTFFPHSPHIQSCLKIMLNFQTQPCQGQKGLLVIGSREANYFGGSKDTLFLEFIGNLLERLLPNCLNLSQGVEHEHGHHHHL